MGIINRVSKYYPGSLIHRYPLISDTNDIVGSANLTNSGVSFSGDAAVFETADYLVSSASIGGEVSNFSILLWIKITNWTNGVLHILFATGTSDATPIGAYYHGNKSYIYLLNGAGNLAHSGTPTENQYNSTNFPNTAFVLHLVTWNGTTLKLYRGTTEIVSDSTTLTGLSTSKLLIGYSGVSENGIVGSVLDSRVYNVCLSSSEISSIVSAGPNPA